VKISSLKVKTLFEITVSFYDLGELKIVAADCFCTASCSCWPSPAETQHHH